MDTTSIKAIADMVKDLSEQKNRLEEAASVTEKIIRDITEKLEDICFELLESTYNFDPNKIYFAPKFIVSRLGIKEYRPICEFSEIDVQEETIRMSLMSANEYDDYKFVLSYDDLKDLEIYDAPDTGILYYLSIKDLDGNPIWHYSDNSLEIVYKRYIHETHNLKILFPRKGNWKYRAEYVAKNNGHILNIIEKTEGD